MLGGTEFVSVASQDTLHPWEDLEEERSTFLETVLRTFEGRYYRRLSVFETYNHCKPMKRYLLWRPS